jgi:hypothetical protein
MNIFSIDKQKCRARSRMQFEMVALRCSSRQLLYQQYLSSSLAALQSHHHHSSSFGPPVPSIHPSIHPLSNIRLSIGRLTCVCIFFFFFRQNSFLFTRFAKSSCLSMVADILKIILFSQHVFPLLLSRIDAWHYLINCTFISTVIGRV